MRAHLGIRAHVCNTCGKTFVEKSHLVRHQALHTDVRLQCDQCDYTTPRKDKLKDHINKHHSEGATPKTPKKAKMITVNKAEKKAKPAERLEVTAPLLVKWDHGGYSRYAVSQEQGETTVQSDSVTETVPILNTDNDYNVLRDQIGSNEPIQQILTMDQINGAISVAKAMEPGTIVGQVTSNIVDGENTLNPNQAVRVISSNVPCLNLVQNPVQLDQVVVNGSPASSSTEGTDSSHTYTIIQSSTPGTIQPEYGGLGAFMALF